MKSYLTSLHAKTTRGAKHPPPQVDESRRSLERGVDLRTDRWTAGRRRTAIRSFSLVRPHLRALPLRVCGATSHDDRAERPPHHFVARFSQPFIGTSTPFSGLRSRVGSIECRCGEAWLGRATPKKPLQVKPATVKIHKRGPAVERIADATALAGIVHLAVAALGTYTAPIAVLSPPAAKTFRDGGCLAATLPTAAIARRSRRYGVERPPQTRRTVVSVASPA